jgi:DNA end-binding protein Ku
LSFGLVNVPVLVFPATRQSGVRTRLVSPGGAFLQRRYYCPRDDKLVPPDDLVRGFELNDGSYVVVSDEELLAIEPEKSRAIDLQQFVKLSELPPSILERGYYLAPLEESAKAYCLLAEVMEETGQAGIATVVMRDREYLVAIFARDGILCAETLRFEDELRDPETIGLPESDTASKARVSAFERSINWLYSKAIPLEELSDKEAQSVQAVAEKKRKLGRDLIKKDAQNAEQDEGEEGEVDLLETIRKSLRRPEAGSKTRPKATRRPANARSGKWPLKKR